MLAEKYHYSPLRKKLVPCNARIKCRLGSTHLSKAEYVEVNVRAPNRKYNRDVFFARRRVTDPYALHVVHASQGNQSLAGRWLAGELSDAEYKAAKDGTTAPLRHTDLEHVQMFFHGLKAITIPEGTVVRSTSPKFNAQRGLYVEDKRYAVKVLNVCHGSAAVGDAVAFKDQFHPVSVTWVGKDGYFYNAEIDQRLINYNAGRATDSSANEFYRQVEALHPDEKLRRAMERSMLFEFETAQRLHALPTDAT